MSRLRLRRLGRAALLGLLFLAACAPQATPTDTPVSPDTPTPTETPSPIPLAQLPTRVQPTDGPTPTLLPTETYTPSITPTPSDTPTPTETPIPTDTPIPSDTPTPTETASPTPSLTEEPAPALSIAILWESTGNVDLGVEEPNGNIISAFAPQSAQTGGQFSGDANGQCASATNSPSEAVEWEPGQAQVGGYSVFARYQTACGNEGPVAIDVLVTLGSDVTLRRAALLPLGQQVEITFVYDPEAGTTQLTTPQATATLEITRQPPSFIAYGSTANGMIADAQPEVIYNFPGTAGDPVVIEMTQTDGDLDPYLILRDSQGNEVGRDDDSAGDRNARLEVSLPATGTFTIVATRFQQENGTSSGSYSLVLRLGVSAQATTSSQGTPSPTPLPTDLPPILFGQPVTGTIDDQTSERRYTFQGRQGDMITIRLEQRNGDLDPFLILQEAGGRELASNDDADSNTLNSAIRDYRLPSSGFYTIVATRFQGASGTSSGGYTLILDRGGVQPGRSVEGSYLPDRSGAVSSAGQVFSTVFPGDDGQGTDYQGFLSFELPAEITAQSSIASAQLLLGDCTFNSTPFTTLGALAVEQVVFDSLNAQAYGGIIANRVLGEVTACPAQPVDVLPAVRRALQSGGRIVQFRLAFPGSNGDGAIDDATFRAPRLEITLPQ